MTKKTKRWLTAASALVIVGCIIFGGVMTIFKWDFSKLSTEKYETREYALTEAYSDISIVTKEACVELLPSEDGSTRVVLYEQIKVTHDVSVKDGTLEISVKDARKWYDYIALSRHSIRNSAISVQSHV